MKNTLIILLSLALFACSNSSDGQSEDFICQSTPLNAQLSYNQLIDDIPSELIEAFVETTDESGAMGRNKDDYFHVRFQFGMTTLIDYATKFESTEAIEMYLDNLTYAFAHQMTDGGFEFRPPADLAHLSFTDGDLASATAFFGYSLAISLNSLNESDWFNQTTSLTPARMALAEFKTQITQTLDYLKGQESLLKTYDAAAPNRLFFDAIVFYGLGRYLNDEEAKSIGLNFAEQALTLREETSGYFIEGGGWDSSYNGVAIKIGFELYTLLDTEPTTDLKINLAAALTCATDWQGSRILETGEISDEGNTRVYAGGESFLGTEKQIDVAKTVKAFYYMNSLSGIATYISLAENIIDYYQ